MYCDTAVGLASARSRLVPGLTVAVAVAMAGAFLAMYYGTPLTVTSLLVGFALNFLGSDERLRQGLTFASTTLLRLAIVLLGARISLSDFATIGPLPFAALAAIMASAVLVGMLVSRALRLEATFGLMASGSIAICGASAAAALAGVLGERRVRSGELSIVLLGTIAISSASMILYPIIASSLGLNDEQAGFLLGATIADVAQALGAGYGHSLMAGEAATIVKLSRVALLAPLLLVLGMVLARRASPSSGRSAPLPWFVAGFLAMAALNSIGLIPNQLADHSHSAAIALLTCAISASAVLAPLPMLRQLALRPLVVLVSASLASLLVALMCIAGLELARA